MGREVSSPHVKSKVEATKPHHFFFKFVEKFEVLFYRGEVFEDDLSFLVVLRSLLQSIFTWKTYRNKLFYLRVNKYFQIIH